ncbi:MAG: methionine ABC transporter ATP-binding protein [Burkholderiaceae bacterium]|nr:methionine ABC transporter ATP-binding protein [Burkholderiaceae bacterium]
MIRLEHVTKRFQSPSGDTTAVKDVSLHIREGEIFGIIGFSGAGKSTLVRCINLLETPTEGKVFIDQTELTSLSAPALREVRKKIGMIFQNFNLMPSRTVYENIEMPLKLSTLSAEDRKARILDLLNLVGLSEKKDSYPSELSGGQKQRVAIARALANNPKVLLCDEATSALDPQTTHSILKLLQEVNRRLRITVVVITHQMSVVKDICDRVAVMEHGAVVEEGTVLQVFSRPKASITKGFIEMADNLGSFHELLQEGNLPGIDKSTPVWFLTFTGESVGQAVVSRISIDFNVEINIVYGNIDFLKGQMLGKLGVSVRGTPENVNKAKSYLADQHIEVEVLQ